MRFLFLYNNIDLKKSVMCVKIYNVFKGGKL